METAFPDYQEKLVFQFIGNLHTTELQAAAPSGHFLFFHGVHDFPEFINLFFRISVRRMTLEAVQFFVVVILYLFADGCQQTFFFTDLMLSATFPVHRLDFRGFGQFSAVNLLLYGAVVENPATSPKRTTPINMMTKIHMIQSVLSEMKTSLLQIFPEPGI